MKIPVFYFSKIAVKVAWGDSWISTQFSKDADSDIGKTCQFTKNKLIFSD